MKQWTVLVLLKVPVKVEVKTRGIGKNIPHSSDGGSNVDHLFGARNIQNFIPDDTILVRDSNGDNYSVYFDSHG